MPYGHLAVNYAKPLMIGKHVDTAQSYVTSSGFAIITNGFTQCAPEYNENLYKHGTKFSTLIFCVRLQLCMALQVFAEVVKKNNIANQLAPGTCVAAVTSY